MEGGKEMRAALYARVSSEEQVEGYSIDAQSRAFRLLCESKQWTPHREYIEEGKSARTENINKRPVFKQAMDGSGMNMNITAINPSGKREGKKKDKRS